MVNMAGVTQCVLYTRNLGLSCKDASETKTDHTQIASTNVCIQETPINADLESPKQNLFNALHGTYMTLLTQLKGT